MPRADAIDEDLFAAGYKEAPYWWEAAPRPSIKPGPLPAKADVVVVGSGITGLNAARELARAGRDVVVLEAGDAGIGASSRNAGFVGRTLKHEFGALLSQHGPARAVAVYREMHAAFEAVAEVVATERIDCAFKRCGRLVLARSSGQLSALAAELELKRQHLGEAYRLLGRDELSGEIACERFVGGAVIPDLGAIHPGLYHQGLLESALKAGVTLVTRTRVTGLAAGVRVDTERGSITAREVVLATNGTTGPGLPDWLRRRLIPFDAYMFATEALPEAVVRTLLPTDRTYIDCNHNIIYLRRSPDHRHVLFGGRTGPRPPRDLRAVATQLHRDASALVPGLKPLKIGFAWTGRCAGTFDLYPHLARRGPVWFAGGYCFAGVPMGTYLGRKLAWQMLGRPEGATLFAERAFPTVPFYRGEPWFVPALMRGYDWLDARASRGRDARGSAIPVARAA